MLSSTFEDKALNPTSLSVGVLKKKKEEKIAVLPISVYNASKVF